MVVYNALQGTYNVRDRSVFNVKRALELVPSSFRRKFVVATVNAVGINRKLEEYVSAKGGWAKHAVGKDSHSHLSLNLTPPAKPLGVDPGGVVMPTSLLSLFNSDMITLARWDASCTNRSDNDTSCSNLYIMSSRVASGRSLITLQKRDGIQAPQLLQLNQLQPERILPRYA